MLRRMSVYAAVFVVLYFYFISFFPGYFTADSIYILNMASGNAQISDWHPNFYVWLTRVLLAIFRYPSAIWLLQIAAWTGAVFFAAQRLPCFRLPAFLMIALLPPLAANMAALWKDDWAIIVTIAAMAAALRQCEIAATPKIVNGFGRLGELCPGIFAIALAALASAIRTDYLIVAAPIAIAAAWWMVALWHKTIGRGTRNRKRSPIQDGVMHGALALALPAITIPLILLLISAFASLEVERHRNPWVTIAMWDIAGIAVRTDHQFSILGMDFSGELLKEGYNCKTSDPLMFGNAGMPGNPPEVDIRFDLATEAVDYRKQWIRAVRSHPVAYLKHRLCIVRTYLGFDPDIYFAYPFGTPTNNLELTYERSNANIALYFFYDAIVGTILWRPWFWLLLATVSSAVLFRKGAHGLAFIIVASAWGAAARGLVLPAADVRYALWIFVAGAYGTCAAAGSLWLWWRQRVKTSRT